LVIQKGKEQKFEHEGHTMTFTGGEYGWGYERLTTPLEKLNYLSTLVLYTQKDVLASCFKNFDPRRLNRYKHSFEKFVKDTFRVKNVVYKQSTNWGDENYAYIDHQSCEDIEQFDILLDHDAMKTLVLSRESYITISNDNG
jgi:hypothetical protein